MAAKRPPRKFIGFSCATLVGVFMICALAGAVIDALNLDSDPSTSSAQQIAVDPVDPTRTETPFPSTDTPVPPTNTQVPTDTPAPTATLEPLALAECVPPGNGQVMAQVVEVIDGDMIDVVFDDQIHRVSFIGIDAPESTTQVEPFGVEAAEKNRELVEGKTVILVKDVSETDLSGNLPRYVFVDDLFVNFELVRQGYAVVASSPPDLACIEYFQTAEQGARSSEAGLWAMPTPTSTVEVVVQPTAVPTVQEAAKPTREPKSSGNCHPAYPDACLDPNAGDYDCAGGSGNGPNYIRGPITVLPPDPFDLDRNGDGVGCE